MKDYLPSREFLTKLIVVVLLSVLVLGIYKISIFFKNRERNGVNKKLVIKPDVIQKDSNDNGIPDWEESLWGLDPDKNGNENKEFILSKRRELARDSNTSDSVQNGKLSENETLSREFFAIIMSLQESGNLNEESLDAVSQTIGEKITATPISDIYNINMLSTIKNNPANTQAYYNSLSKLINKYDQEDLGRELTFISVGISTNDPGAIALAVKIAGSYRAFAKDALKIQVPTTLATIHLSLLNNYEKTAISIEDMSEVLDNPLNGMKALINYKKYTDGIVSDIEKLSTDLQ